MSSLPSDTPSTTDLQRLIDCAIQIGSILDDRRVAYAIIGGVGCILLGGDRTTMDIDVVVEYPPQEIQSLKTHVIMEKDIPIQLLPLAHNFGWPSSLEDATQTVKLKDMSVKVLDPVAIMISKLMRLWSIRPDPTTDMSKAPKTVAKFESDLHDITKVLKPLMDDGTFREMFRLYKEEKQEVIKRKIEILASELNIQDIKEIESWIPG